jgi:hypothetical protein
MALGVPGLRRAVIASIPLLLAGLLAACGSYKAPGGGGSRGGPPSGLTFRAFISNSTGFSSISPGLQIMDARLDKQFLGSFINGGPQPTFLVLSPDKKLTLTFSPANNSVGLVNNLSESFGGSITLPNFTESLVIANDNSTAYAALPTQPVLGQPAGEIEALDLVRGGIKSKVAVAGVHRLAQSPNGNRILAFSDNSDTVTLIAPSLVGTTTDPRTPLTGFDRPIGAVFSPDSTTAYVLNCGRECAGIQASITKVDLNAFVVGPTLPVSAATVAVLSGNTLYVAGTPLGQLCAAGTTAAPTCGVLDVVDVPSFTVTTSGVLISDGFHDRMAVASNNRVFIGARICTNINTASEQRGCLSIFNPSDSTVTVAPDNGDVTGVQPITGRNAVYVIQGAELRIYDMTTGKLQSKQVDLVGQIVDVKLVD